MLSNGSETSQKLILPNVTANCCCIKRAVWSLKILLPQLFPIFSLNSCQFFKRNNFWGFFLQS